MGFAGKNCGETCTHDGEAHLASPPGKLARHRFCVPMFYGAIATGNRLFLIRCAEHHPHPPPRAVPLPQGEGWGSFFEGIRSTGHSITSTTPNLTHPSICNHVHSIPKKTRFQLGVLTKKTLIFCAPVSISFQAEKEVPPISIRFPHAYFPPHYIIPLFLQILLSEQIAPKCVSKEKRL